MPEINVTVGGRSYKMACEPGEEASVEQAADLLSHEADTLQGANGRLPEPRMLLMSGLMLADRTIEIAAKMEAAEAEIEELKDALKAAQSHVARDAQAEASDQVGAKDMARALDVIRTAAERAEALANG